MLRYVIQHLGEGVKSGQNLMAIYHLQQMTVRRFMEVWRKNKADAMKSARERREELREKFLAPRKRTLQAQWQLQVDLGKLALLESMEQFELFLRQIRLQGTIIVAGKLKKLQDLIRERPEVVHKKLIDRNAETRWMAIQVVAIKRYPFQSALINRLNDSDNSVRQAARQALIRVSRGNDFGPKIKAGTSERQLAISKWKHWWSLQDSNPRHQLLRSAERP